MKGNEILSKSKYFEFIKGRHRRAKDQTKVHYVIKNQLRVYLSFEEGITDEDLERIHKIVDPNRNINSNDDRYEWRYKDYEKAHKIFTMLMLSGY